MQKNFNDTKQHFSIRKLTIGAASVLIGTTFYLAGGNIAHADAFTPASDQQETSALNNDQDDSSKVQANLDNQTDDTNRSETGEISESSKNQNITIQIEHGMTGIPKGTKLSNEDLGGEPQDYTFVEDINYQGNIPDNIKPADIHRVVHYSLKVDADGNIAYRDNVTGKVTLNGWIHDVESLPAVTTPDIVAPNGTIYKVDKITASEYMPGQGMSDPTDVQSIDEIDKTILDNIDEPDLDNTGKDQITYVVTYKSTPATLEVDYVDCKTGKPINTQIINGNVGQKMTQDELPVPDGYYVISSKIPDALVDGKNTATVTVIKKETSNGTPTTQPELATKNIIVYKDKDGNVVSTQDLDGKPGNKVTPKIPDGYAVDGDIPDVTIPSDGKPITIAVVKKATSNGDSLAQPNLPAYTESGDNNTDSDATPADPSETNGSDTIDKGSETSNVPNNVNNKSEQGNSNTKLIKRVANNASGSIHTVHNTTNASSGNKQNTLPQTGEKHDDAVALGALIASLGALMTGLYSRLKKRN